MSNADVPPAPSTDVRVRPGGNGDQFLVFDSDGDYRHVEVLNETDARDLYNQLDEVYADE